MSILFLKAGEDFSQTFFLWGMHMMGSRKADFLAVPLPMLFLRSRKHFPRKEGRIMAKAIGHCAVWLIVETASSGFVKGNIRGRTWHQTHGGSLPCSPWCISQMLVDPYDFKPLRKGT